MSEPDQPPITHNPALARELSPLSQAFALFNDLHTCFFDALAKVMMAGRVMDAGSVGGFRHCAHWMKRRMDELRHRLEILEGLPLYKAP